ncbi:putative glycolipid-binding domain-containing protein [Pararhizobium gei]|uniref:putative glycolipid-binding domain-containing protein n=1 Tax=Pararhizobium gei TaxID=1395951 RepID=UPI0023DAC0B1|nr:putative glycolipid-binding domain-containing protein [Rhizobium gei]
MFRALPFKTVRWRPLEGVGLEHLTLGHIEGGGICASSVVIGERGGRPYGIHYQIDCDEHWTVLSLDIQTTDGLRLGLTSDGRGHWTDEAGLPLPAFDGCIDIDLAGSPFTNTLPVRRLGLTPEDGTVKLSMLYVPFDTFEPCLDRQHYTCLTESKLYRYEADDRSFAAELPVDEDGLVMDYPTLFQRL